MTRENKLALVVGFGLILFVGILVSDHFSIVRSQQPADLTRLAAIDDPLITSRAEDPQLIELEPFIPPQPAVNPGTLVNDPVIGVNATPRPDSSPAATSDTQIAGGDSQATPDGFVPAGEAPEAIPLVVKAHDVRDGESLFGICRQHYGDTSLVKALAKFNGMDNPASLRAGAKLKIPPAELIGGRSAAATSAPKTAMPPTGRPPALRIVNETPSLAQRGSKPARAGTYTVKPGDNLAVIAKRVLGSQKKWKQLYELNRNVIDDPDDVKVGIVLKLL